MNRIFLRLQLSDIVFIAVFLLALSLGRGMLGQDSDLGRHLTLGNFILDERVIPTHDLFSHTRAGLSRPPYEWLAQILFTLSHRLLGLDGVVLLTSFVIALTFGLVYRHAIRKSGSALIAIVLTFIATGASSIHWLPRPHIFTFLLLVIWIDLLDQLARGRHIKLYKLPIIMLLWANLHGGFVYGMLAWIAYLAGWAWDKRFGRPEKQIGKRLLAAGITSFLATIITPDLWRNWEAVLNNRSGFILSRTIETMRPALTEVSILPFTLLFAVTVLVFILNWHRLKADHFFLITGLGVLSLLMVRNIPLFAIASTPILSRMIARHLSRSRTWTGIENRFIGFSSSSVQSLWSYTTVLAAIALFINFNIKHGRSVHQFDTSLFPVDAADFIVANPQQGKMFNDFNWGGYLLYRLWPENTVFLDSQSDFYGESLMREYDQVMIASGDWQDLLKKYQIAWVIIPVESPLADMIENTLNWEIIHADDVAVIGRRK